MIQQNSPANPEIHKAACIIAKRCRNVIQACLREDEWRLADEEFYRVCREVMDELAAFKGVKS